MQENCKQGQFRIAVALIEDLELLSSCYFHEMKLHCRYAAEMKLQRYNVAMQQKWRETET